ncbi:MAG: putative Ig domain-containing protein [Nitrospirae bacterium]|nr:putative Ig domain-containing protein [Nitrospirota bacterium]
MRRSSILFNFLAAAGLVGLLSGCGSGGGGTTTSTGGTTSGSAAATGTITGFGSVIVNGKEFDTDGALLIIDGQQVPCTVSQSSKCGLKRGMTVTVTGSFNGNKWLASTLLQKDAVEGLVQSIAADGLSLVVMGQTVLVDSATLIDENIPGQNILSLLAGQDSVEVNGYIRSNGEIQATFIEKNGPGTVTPEVQGLVSGHQPGLNTFQIGALIVNYAGADFSNMPDPNGTRWNGLFVEIKGTDLNSFDPVTTTLTASRVEPENQGLATNNIDQFYVQGAVTQTQVGGTDDFLIGTTRVRTTANTEFLGVTIGTITVNATLSVDGQLANGILTATHVVANAAPVITSTPILAGTQGVAYSYDVEATDPNGDTLTYSLVAPAPFGMTIDPASGLIAWTPAAQVGDNPVTVQVSDGSLSSSQTFTVKVAAAVAPAAPGLITPTVLPPAFVQTPYTTTVNATDANGDTLTYSLVGPVPAGMTIVPGTGVISWTAAAGQVGPNAVTVRAQDNSSSSLATSQTFTINVETATAASGVTFGFDDLTRGGYNVTQPGIWTNIGPDAFSTASGSAIIVRGDLTVILDSNGRPRFNQPEFIFLGVTLINRGTTDATFAIAGYNGSHGVTDFYYTVTMKPGDPPFRVQNSFLDNLNRPMNVSIERLEVNGSSLSTPDFGVSCLGVGTSGGALTCP